MKREILLRHECTAIASQHGLGGLHELALYQHSEKMLQDLSEFFNGSPTVTKGFYFSPACGECAVIFATAGASHEEDGLEGVRFFFQPHETAEAEKALLVELGQYEPENFSPSFSVV